LTLDRIGIAAGVTLILGIPVALNLVGLKATAIGCALLVAFGLVVVALSLFRRSGERDAELLEIVGVTCVMGGTLMQFAWLADALDRTGILAIPILVWPIVAIFYAYLRRRLGVVNGHVTQASGSSGDREDVSAE
jgi:hypothetical protein